MPEYSGYMRKLYYARDPEGDITFQEWIKVFEHVIEEMLRGGFTDTDILRTTDAMLSMINKRHICAEDYRLQLVEAPPLAASEDINSFLMKAQKDGYKEPVSTLYQLLKFKLQIH